MLRKRAAIESLQATLATMMRKVQAIYVLFASVIAFGVVYNSVRISLSERSRELATLRVIGFTRGEVSYILLGELGAGDAGRRTARPGARLRDGGRRSCVRPTRRCSASRSSSARTPTLLSAATIVVATVLSALVVRRRLDRLDLVEVLKTRE